VRRDCRESWSTISINEKLSGYVKSYTLAAKLKTASFSNITSEQKTVLI
jgi:hypothetical protein